MAADEAGREEVEARDAGAPEPLAHAEAWCFCGHAEDAHYTEGPETLWGVPTCNGCWNAIDRDDDDWFRHLTPCAHAFSERAPEPASSLLDDRIAASLAETLRYVKVYFETGNTDGARVAAYNVVCAALDNYERALTSRPQASDDLLDAADLERVLSVVEMGFGITPDDRRIIAIVVERALVDRRKA